MRRILALLSVVGLLLAWTRAPLILAWARSPFAQFGEGRPTGSVLSPHESTEGTVDGAAMSIVYGRPSMRGRKIFGGLVPYDRIWCPGADECTRLTTNRSLQFAGVKLEAGEYTLWMEPTKTVWSLIFNSDAHAFHTRHSPRLDVGTIQLEKQTLPSPVEKLTFTIEPNRSGSGGAIVMSWETTRVSAPFTVVR